MNVDTTRFSRLDWGIVGGGAVAFVSGFLPWWGYSGPLNAYNGSVSGWSAGFYAWAGILLLTLAAVYLFLRRSEVSLPELPIGPTVAVTGTAGVGLLLVLLRWVTLPSVHAGAAGSIGPRFGIWLAVLAGIVEVGCAVASLRRSGEPMPWAQTTPATPES